MLKQSKHKQPEKEEREVVYSQIAHDMEKTRNVIRRSVSHVLPLYQLKSDRWF